ncbi:MAG: outer membrane beta-barrel protein [Bacteroidaceae bacterium]|nr:outer membrane beta-barrel protein [Bacteroidaceae bacterium]
MKRFSIFQYIVLIVVLIFAGWLPVMAQQNKNEALNGRVIDNSTAEPMPNTTLQLYEITTRRNRTDTTFVKGAYSDQNGRFSFSSINSGTYMLKLSFLGYQPRFVSFEKKGRQNMSLGTISLNPEIRELDETVVTANLPKMVVKDDTLIYNADAFTVPEGSVIEALVEVLPGAEIDENGGITINGKQVKRFKLDGRDFMTGNNSAVMKNLPSYVIDKVKVYDEKSDLSRLTGIDDGEDDFVMEFTIKKSAKRGLQANPDLGYGTDNRYGIRLTAMKPFGAMRYTFMGNANNVNDRNFSGRGGRGRGNGNGQRNTQTGALDISYENDKDIKLSGRVTWTHSTTDNWNRTGSENFVNTRGGSFSNSISQSYSRNNSWTGNMNLQWTIDSVTTFSFRPNFTYSTNDSRSHSSNASFNADPFEHVTNPLSNEGLSTMNDLGLVVNGRQNKSMGYGENKNLSTQLQLHRRFSNNGRNLAVNGNINYSKNRNRNANLSMVHLYKTQNASGNDSTYQTNRYTVSPSNNFNYNVGITYTEPLYIFKAKPEPVDTLSTDSILPQENMRGNRGGGNRGGGPGGGGPGGGGNRGGGGNQRNAGSQGIFLQVNYNFRYSYQKSDPLTYDFPDLGEEAFNVVLQDYRDWNRLFGCLDNPYEEYLSTRLSRYSERKEYGHTINIQLRYVRDKINMNLGVSAQPQRSRYIQQYLGRPIDTTRTVTNYTPTLNMRYRFTQQSNLQVTLRGQTQQPSITQLLNIYDDTNPLSITMGNPGLKPSFTTNFDVNYQRQSAPKYVEDSLGNTIPKAQRRWSYSTNASVRSTRNTVGNIVTYDEETGGRISRPENFNGNWSTNGGATFNISLDTLNRWDVSGSLRGSYNHHVSYVNLNRSASSERNVTHTYNFTPSVSLSFRKKNISVSLNTNVTYARTENELQASRNLATWNFQYGGNTKITFPWGTSLSTDFHMYSKRGYSDQSLNTNELLWNAQLSHAFLRGKKLTVMLQWYDILHEQSNFTRTVNANGWTDREVNSITSYAMLHLTYRINVFGGRQSARGGGRR